VKVNVAHMLRLAGNHAGGSFRHSLPELADNLRELRDRAQAGDAQAACAEFFALYVFGDEGSSSPRRAE
jgi:hypothetical protein